MAIAQVADESLLQAVKRAIESSSTCDLTTLKTLEQLLGHDGSSPSRQDPQNLPNTIKTRVTGQRKTISAPARAKHSAASKVTVCEDSENKIDKRLGTSAKIALATDVFNSALKRLTDECKTLPSATANTGLETSPSKPKKPLQPISPNPKIKSPIADKGSSITSGLKTYSHPAIEVVAQCAHRALTALRDLQSQNPQQGKGSKVQLLQATTILTGKLVSLDLADLAWIELRAAKNLLESIEGPQHISEDARRKFQHPVNLLLTIRLPKLESVSKLAITFTIHVLKFCALRTSKAVSEDLISLLGSRQDGPIQLVLSCLQARQITSEYASQQLASLSQCILSLSRAYLGPTTQPSSLNTRRKFVLQCTALKARCKWWHIADHKPDIDQELWKPLYKYISAFSKTARTLEEEDLALCKSQIGNLKGELLQHNLAAVKDAVVPASISEILAEIAERSGCIQEALTIYQSSQEPSEKGPDLHTAICLCKIACLRLQNLSNSQLSVAMESLSAARSALLAPMKGAAPALDELFKKVLQLQRVTARIFINCGNENNNMGLEPGQLKRAKMCCVRATYDIVLFTLRYVGETPLEHHEDKSRVSRYATRIDQAMRNGSTTIETFFIICRKAIESNDVPWEETESALSSFGTLAQKMEGHHLGEVEARPEDSRQPLCVRISNLYWARYLQLKNAGEPPVKLTASLHKSVHSLKCRPLAEKCTGNLAEKLYRLGNNLNDVEEPGEAAKYYQKSLATFSELGSIAQLSIAAAHKSFDDVWAADQSLLIGKILLAHTTIAMKLPKPLKVLLTLPEMEFLSDADKCLLIEKQVRIVSRLVAADIDKQLLQTLWERTLTAHNIEEFPIRRLRNLHQILKADSEASITLSEALRSKICSEVVKMDPLQKDLAYDNHLAQFRPHMLSSAQLLATFQSARPSFDLCKHAVASWKIHLQACNDWQSVKNYIEDPPSFLILLDTLADYADMHNWIWLCLDICDLKIHLLELQPKSKSSILLRSHSVKGFYLTQLGLSVQAGQSFGRSKAFLGKGECDKAESLQWTLAYAEYLLSIANLDQTAEALQSAQTLYQELFKSDSASKNDLYWKIKLETLLAQASFIHTRLMLGKQRTCSALLSAKKCAKLTSKAWKTLEKAAGTSSQLNRSCESDSSDLEPDRLVQGERQTSISNDNTVACDSLFGSRFWPYVSLHCRCLVQLANLSAETGLFQDTVYYSEQARKVARAVGAESWLARVECVSALYFARANMLSESTDQMQRYQHKAGQLGKEGNAYENQLCLAEAKFHTEASQQQSDIMHILQMASDELQSLQQKAPNSTSEVQLLEQSFTQLRIDQKASKAAQEPKPLRRNKPLARKDLQASMSEKPKHSASPVPYEDSLPMVRTTQRINLLRAKVLLQSGGLEDATDILQPENIRCLDLEGQVSFIVLVATALLSKITRSLSVNAVYCVVGESVVAYPSVSSGGPSCKRRLGATRETKKVIGKGKTSSRRKSPLTNHNDPSMLLQEAREKLFGARGMLNNLTNITLIREFCSCWNNLILLSAVLGYDLDGEPGAMHAISCLDRTYPIMRERSMICLDKYFAAREQISIWPGDDVERAFPQPDVDSLLASASLTKILPDGWDAISMRLSDDSKEIFVTKISKDLVPFHLRLPLCRSNADGATETDEPFDFHRCKDELLDIIQHANRTSHDGRVCKNKQSKKEWWAEREALDEQLKTLLENVENMWFGGFKGIFSQHSRQIELLSRFSGSFQQILNQNLPSRRRCVAHTVSLHPQVLGLFVALGNPSETDIDDGIMDLLYFVVDILQFQGERNAYDEIDFDAMLVQTIDAIRGYFDAWKPANRRTSHHTILILDKSLHAFPWESLPCLQGQSVSRLPSLMCLRTRIAQIGDVENPSDGLAISRTSGSYILNPSTDLKATEEAFAERFLKELPSFSSVVSRAPTEDEFKSSLEDHGICLYFGHGSGAQYIRGRTVRRLDGCAVTFLMGCSSSKLVECGGFEPYGVPWNYMHAGAPAVVGTLWDVTDKDIDRFATQTLESWGLLDTPEVEAELKDFSTKSKRKGKTPTVSKEKEKSPVKKGVMALDSAVSKARDACLLRYLNGAAPVIYGIPVHLAPV